MKKLVLALALVVGAAGASFASNYKLNESAIDAAFASADVITMTSVEMSNDFTSSAVADGEITKGGFLLRAFFCGFVGMHRGYMGNGGKKVGLYYCLLSLVGGLGSYIAYIDFWYVIIKGEEALNKYKDNPKFLVFLGD